MLDSLIGQGPSCSATNCGTTSASLALPQRQIIRLRPPPGAGVAGGRKKTYACRLIFLRWFILLPSRRKEFCKIECFAGRAFMNSIDFLAFFAPCRPGDDDVGNCSEGSRNGRLEGKFERRLAC